MSILSEIAAKHPIRRTKRQKASFCDFVLSQAREKGLDARVERIGNNDNVVVGDPGTARAVFVAHYDTPCASFFPNLMLPRNVVLFYLYQFLPIILMLTIAMLPAYFIGFELLNSHTAYMAIFLVLYFGQFIMLMYGMPNKNNLNDNSSGVVVLLNAIQKANRDDLADVAFILFDNEEKGKLGSKAYNKAHKSEMKNRLVVNFDCVGVGNNVLFIAPRSAEALGEYHALKNAFSSDENYSVNFFPTKGSEANSDHKSFPCGTCCVVCKRNKLGIYYTPNIHTHRDTKCDDGNITFLSDSIIKYLHG